MASLSTWSHIVDRSLVKVLAQGRTSVFSFGQPASLQLWNDELDKLADVVHGRITAAEDKSAVGA